MGLEKQRTQAILWLGQAEDDLAAARALESAGRYAQACFMCQQAGEKALKAVWYFFGIEPWGHSLSNLIEEIEIESVKQRLMPLKEAAASLDKLYIPTRYPNGLPNMMPRDAYFNKDSSEAVAAAIEVLETAKAACNV